MVEKTQKEKLNTVIEKNTFYFYNKEFEQEYESYLNCLNQTLLLLKNEIDNSNNKLSKELINTFLLREYGLDSILALTGISDESLKRLITLIRATNDETLTRVSLKTKWSSESVENINEWNIEKIKSLVIKNKDFREGLVNLFFEGATIPFLVKTIAPFNLKKLSISKLKFEVESIIDTLTRYKVKGSYYGKKQNNAETVIAEVISDLNLSYETGKLKDIVREHKSINRTMDFIIPNKKNPKIIIESSYLVTTSSGQGDKAKTEIGVSSIIKSSYPTAKFISFVDGMGWYVRKQDLARMVEAYEDVFTLHEDELTRFREFLSVCL
ncbi:hypothetical protein PCC7424_3052 [Gloeothece citriformis PCC 7424]|uniref:BanI/HgiCI C-terminal domain-containing protein n=1 Tax=Gloeothece citriformis (strain PCC 7424) TaxID=65393 RepID=B7KB98_GLOC7|nr:DpnII family type II restriction endonuclease [Gloeothece citriformis]ACK71454.1 hypothetical protein PCC7424_3052 [Gloeothece citriformis PCC 7424]